MTEQKSDEKPNHKIMPEVEPTQDELDELDELDDEGDEDDADDDEESEGVNVYTIYLVDNPTPVPAIDTREHADLLTDFGAAVAAKDSLPFFAFTGDPDEGFVGMALVRIDQVATIQSVVTEAELLEYLVKDDEEEDGDVVETAEEMAKRAAEERRERRRARKIAEQEAREGKAKAGNKGPKGGKLKGLVKP
jgi:hypothetical protein